MGEGHHIHRVERLSLVVPEAKRSEGNTSSEGLRVARAGGLTSVVKVGCLWRLVYSTGPLVSGGRPGHSRRGGHLQHTLGWGGVAPTPITSLIPCLACSTGSRHRKQELSLPYLKKRVIARIPARSLPPSWRLRLGLQTADPNLIGSPKPPL